MIRTMKIVVPDSLRQWQSLRMAHGFHSKMEVKLMKQNGKHRLFWMILCLICLLTGLAVAEGCAICGGDAVCDTCGGLGYLEKKAYGSDEMVKIACEGGCVEGKCPVCPPYRIFQDPVVEAAVRKVLRKDSGEISYEELMKITELDFDNAGLTSIEDLQYMKNLQTLSLRRNNLTDISPLAGLTSLTELNLWENQISDLSPLSGLVNLTTLDLRVNQIDDLSPLAELTSLTSLQLGENLISDISPLNGLNRLKKLSVGKNRIEDVSQMGEWTHLTELYLNNCNLHDISFLAGLNHLEMLFLGRNQIEDISPLANLTSLTILDLSENKISDISPLAGLTELEELVLIDNCIDDFSPLDGLALGDMLFTESQATYTPAPTATPTPTPKPTATPNPYKAPIVGNDGLLVMSPEEYLGIDTCDDIVQEKNYYGYEYKNRGLYASSYGKGMEDPVDWYEMEDYVDALVDSGYYKVVAHEKPKDHEEYWYLSYIGPGSVKRVISPYNSTNAKAAIVVSSFIGDISVYYSLDVITNDLEDTQYRLNEYINVVNPRPTSGGGGGSSGHYETVEEEVDCPSCTFGNCSICGGDGKYERYGKVVFCDPDCGSCGGKGKIKRTKQVWVND